MPQYFVSSYSLSDINQYFSIHRTTRYLPLHNKIKKKWIWFAINKNRALLVIRSLETNPNRNFYNLFRAIKNFQRLLIYFTTCNIEMYFCWKHVSPALRRTLPFRLNFQLNSVILIPLLSAGFVSLILLLWGLFAEKWRRDLWLRIVTKWSPRVTNSATCKKGFSSKNASVL